MGLKEELNREMHNVMKDVDKTWTIEYEGHHIEIIKMKTKDKETRRFAKQLLKK